MLTINNTKTSNEYSSQNLAATGDFGIKYGDTSPLDMAPISMTDNTYNYQHLDSTYVSGNVVRVAPINLPSFIKETVPSGPEEKLIAKSLVSSSSVPAASLYSGFKVPLLVNVNRWLQLGLIALCGLALLAYSLDVIISHDVMKRQEQVRRLSEQNAELSARLLKSISFQGIQESVLGQGMGPANLHVADEVLIAREVPPVATLPFKPTKHHLPLLSGY